MLTVCRVVAFLQTGAQLSKHAAAEYGRETLHGWAQLIAWADDWWYGGGSEDAPDRLPEVTEFVRAASSGAAVDGGPARPAGRAPAGQGS